MQFIHKLLIFGLTIAVIYLWFFRKPQQIFHEKITIVAETPLRRLSAFFDSQVDNVFKPLEPTESLMPTQEIRQIRQTIEDLRHKSNADQEKRIYSVGISICDQLLQAIYEREQHNRRLADMRKKGFDSLLGKDEAKKKQAFFESSVMRSWEEKATRFRDRVQSDYDHMRLLER
jgi:hypothetical protein